jgi:hypothetical protein
MPWTILHPSFRSCQVEPTTCTSHCTLLNSHLRARCQCLHCRIPLQPQFSSAYPLDEFSCLVWTFHRPAHVRQQSALPIYPPVGMAASTPRHCFGQPVEVCTSCTFDTVTNHPHQKNLTPSSDKFEVPLHRICSSS